MPGLEDLSELSEAISSVSSQNINLKTFIREEWIHSLNGNMHSKKFTLRSGCDFVKNCQAYLERWNRPSEYLDNYIKRLEGYICLPALVLQNPPENEELPFDMLVASSPTFQWLNSILRPLGLSIKNVRTINLFPFITENWLRSLGPADQEKALRESLDLTIELFKTYQLETVISCQCLTQKAPEWLGPLVYHPLVRGLSSSVLNAKNRAIKTVQLYGRTINVIQGFHPSYILRAPRETYRNDRHRILSSLLTDTYAPCQLWRKQEIIASMGNMLPQLQESASNLRNLIWSFQALEQKLYTVSSNTDYYVYSGDRGNGGNEPPFSIQLWLKVLCYSCSVYRHRPWLWG
ncbi:hypothetical protein UA08_09449 [Talaromyces atroroseus]|uniref:Uncharacterized protein n=1 Tax=Talaromyces atroroseus TaxID=1441469 RepID=A0A225A4S4_TALAT|nr:hypothetical protein UA08_09449 [Talaromyces atroroseus]OKL55281.1 hypothetical protein UA08_09449 [Talaromyces atroroseus]